jgi:hypothetical protein
MGQLLLHQWQIGFSFSQLFQFRLQAFIYIQSHYKLINIVLLQLTTVDKFQGQQNGFSLQLTAVDLGYMYFAADLCLNNAMNCSLHFNFCFRDPITLH